MLDKMLIFCYNSESMVKNKKLIIILAVLTLIAISVASYVFVIRGDQRNSQQTASTTQEDKVNLDPPTEEDKTRVEQNKQRIVDQQNGQSQTSGSTAKPVITYAEQYQSNVEVGGYVNGIFEDGGTCTAKFSQGSQVVTKSSKGVKNSNNVSCPAIVTPASTLSPKGTWTVTLTYSSPTASGTSDQRTLEVK